MRSNEQLRSFNKENPDKVSSKTKKPNHVDPEKITLSLLVINFNYRLILVMIYAKL